MNAKERGALVRSNIRGSSLLLSGRSLAIGIKFFVQVLIVRYLATSDYGAWAYALSVVAFLDGFATLSLNRSVSRFAAIYHERGDHARFHGTVLLVACTILATGIVFAAAVHALPAQLASVTGQDPQPIMLLLVMIFLVPLGAFDTLAVSLFATLGHAGAIFFRRYLLAPLLQLAVVGLLLWQQAGILFLAWGFVGAALAGLAINFWLLVHMYREEGLIEHFRLRGSDLPVHEMFSFSLPLLSEDLLAALIRSSGILLLGYYYGTDDVALFHVVLGLAAQTKVVIESFSLLYVPTASRLYAVDDYEAINDLYWRTAIWIAVLSFPVFALCFVAATPLTTLIFGARYAASGPFLSILAIGGFVEAAMGFNRQTLRVLGRIRTVVVVNLAAAACNILLVLLLVPPLGALGAAIAMSGTWIINNVFRQIGLQRSGIGFRLLDPRYARPYATFAAGAAFLTAVLLVTAHPVVLVLAAVATAAGVLVSTRDALQIGDVFPGLARVPLVRSFVT
jgi:O-antigen/teichoic acid export membrane protein